MKVMEQRLKSEEENYMLIESKYNEIRQLKHDISNQISAAKSMFSDGNPKEAIKHLDKLADSLSDAGRICYTGFSAVDAIINMKWQKALNKSIQFTTKINLYESISIDNMLLCRILSNLLDNAIEGAERCSCVNKYIHISMIQVDKKLRICVINSSDEVDTQNLKSSKSGNGLHGIGVSSIKKAADQLGGVTSFEWEDETFTADMLIKY
jgi:two-component system sensor histidine kinase AgrC